MKLSFLVGGAAISAAPLLLAAQTPASPPDTSIKITFGTFVDGYYAWDFGEPPIFDRSFAGGALFTTQPTRHDEFNVNLMFIEAKLESPRYRGRLALQAGTSVQSNYLGEPTIGQISGGDLSRHIQEAVAGAKLGDGLWVDGGIFFSHMGMESWISRDNPIYTRSLTAEYSPYYQSGFKVTWTASSKLTAQIDVVNGWQNISENNTGKGAGIRLDFTPTSSSVVSYYNFFSDEAGNLLRTFNGVGAKWISGRATLLGQFDVGTQAQSLSAGTASWWGFALIGRAQMNQRVALVGRVEGFHDPDQVLIVTGSFNNVPNGAFRGYGASVGVDVEPLPHVLWRSEIRGFTNADPAFWGHKSSSAKKSDGFVVSSLALTF